MVDKVSPPFAGAQIVGHKVDVHPFEVKAHMVYKALWLIEEMPFAYEEYVGIEGSGAALLNEKVQLLAFEAYSLEEKLPMRIDSEFLSFEETVVGVAALKFEMDILRESGCYLLLTFEYRSVVGNSVLPFGPVGYVFLPLEKVVFGIVDVLPFEKETQKVGCVFHQFEYQSVVGNFVLPFEPETQKVGFAFLQLEKTVFGISEELPFEMETRKVGCAHQPSEQNAVVGAVVDAHKLGYVFYPIEKATLPVVDGMQVLDGNCIQFGSYLAASQSPHLSQHF